MAHSLSWIDPEAFKRLVSETVDRDFGDEGQSRPEPSVPRRSDLMGPSGPAREPQPDPASAPNPARPQAPSGIGRATVRRASRPAAAPVPRDPKPGPEPFSADPGASLDARLRSLMAWACDLTGLTRVLIIDAQGLLVASERAGANAMDEAASVVDLCARRVPAEVSAQDSGTVTMRAGARTHVVVWQTTRHGRTYMTLWGAANPSQSALSLLCGALPEVL